MTTLLPRLVVLLLLPGLAPAASFTPLGHPPDSFVVSPTAVSADGQVVVGNGTSGQSTQAWRWTGATGLQYLGELPGGDAWSSARAVSADGTTIVGSSDSASGREAFRWTVGNGMQGLGLPAEGIRSFADGLSPDGSVVVGSNYPGSSGLNFTAFRWTAGDGMTAIDGVPGGGYAVVGNAGALNDIVIVGGANTREGRQAFRWSGADGLAYLGDLAGGPFDSFATGSSADGGQVVGQSRSGAGREAFLWTVADGMRGLGDLPGGSFDSFASAISADGNVIVGRGDSDGGFRAVVWTPDGGLEHLLDVLVARGAEGLDGWILVEATGVSPDGNWVVGWGEDADGQRQGFRANLSPVPLPGSAWLLGTACIAFTGGFRRLWLLKQDAG